MLTKHSLALNKMMFRKQMLVGSQKTMNTFSLSHIFPSVNSFSLISVPMRSFSGDCSDHRGPADIAQQVQTKLQEVYSGEFDHVEVSNKDGLGQHVHIFVVSDEFKGKLPIARHRAINDILKEEIKHIHAVTIEAKTVDQMKGK